MQPVTIHPLVPDFILQQYRAEVRQGEFSGVGMFVDISGFSKMTNTLMVYGQHGAEVLATVMRAVFTPLIQTVYEHEGFVATLAGDAFTALFPFERAVDAGPVCSEAVQAAWEIQQQMAVNAIHHTPYGTYHITAKIGVAVGEAIWGIVTSEDESQAAYYFRGTVVEECAEVEHAARAGEIILDAVVCQQAPAHARVEPHGNYFRLTGMGAEDDPDTGSFLEWGTIALAYGPGEITRFFPESLVTQEHTGEFRQVVNLFIQMPTVHTGIELEGFMRALFSLQKRYSGLLNRVDFGDKGAHLLMFWGAPVAYGNDIGRALNFVLELQTRTSLPFTAGLTYRISHAGFIGSPLREEYTCYGRGVNLAARFMMAAPRGDVWVDEEIAQRVGDYFELEALGTKVFKGFSEPQSVYQLIERKEQTASSYKGAFVGRQEELAQLMRFVQPVTEGRFAGALLISGEAGIGKSRLLSAFQASPFLRDMKPSPLWALCQNDQILHESLNPFRYWLRQYFKQSSLQGEARNKRNFSHKLDELTAATAGISLEGASLVNELERTRSFLGALLDLYWPADGDIGHSLYGQLEGLARFDNTLIALVALLQAESLRQPVILLIEDAQWLDADSRTFIPQLVRTLTAGGGMYPIAILAAVRLESGGQKTKKELLGVGVEYQNLNLTPFSQRDLETQAAAVLGAPADEALVRLLVARAEGNPFFAEQILRYLLENHDLTQAEDGHFGVRRSLLESKTAEMYSSALPPDARALLVARLDQLTRELRELVQAASVLGREFEVRLLMQMLRDEAQVEEGIKSGEDAALWSAISQLRYLFRHALLRDAAYRMQVRTRRRTLHRLAVEALELLYFENLTPRYGELGYHAEQAGLTEKARHYLQKAGDSAKNAYQNSEAVDYYTRALALTPEGETETIYEIRLAREDVFYKLGYRIAGEEDLSALRHLAENLKDGQKQTKIALLRSRFYDGIGNYERAIETAWEAIHLAEETGNQEQLGHAYLHLGTAFWWQGNYGEADIQAKRAVQIFNEIHNDAGLGDALYLLGETATHKGNYADSEAYLKKALEFTRKIGFQAREASALNDLGLLMSHQRQYREAENYHQQALDIYTKIGDRKGIGKAVNNMGVIRHVLGDYSLAQQSYTQALYISRETGDRQEEAIALNNLGEVLLRQANYLDAKSTFEKALHIEQELGIRYFEAHTLSMYGETLIALYEDTAAKNVFHQVLALRKALEQDFLTTAPNLGLAQVASRGGKKEEALHFLDEALTTLSKYGANGYEDPLSIYWTCYALLADFEDQRAKAILQTAHTQLLEQMANIPDEQIRQSFMKNITINQKILSTTAALGWGTSFPSAS